MITAHVGTVAERTWSVPVVTRGNFQVESYPEPAAEHLDRAFEVWARLVAFGPVGRSESVGVAPALNALLRVPIRDLIEPRKMFTVAELVYTLGKRVGPARGTLEWGTGEDARDRPYVECALCLIRAAGDTPVSLRARLTPELYTCALVCDTGRLSAEEWTILDSIGLPE